MWIVVNMDRIVALKNDGTVGLDENHEFVGKTKKRNSESLKILHIN